MATRILFITGTDTGVGKTLLTALLLCYLRGRGTRALALKPFCSGSRGDAELLHRLQEGDLSLDEVNPFYFAEPVAPLVSARRHKNHVPIEKVVQHIDSMLARLDRGLSSPSNPKTRVSERRAQNYLLIEGSGGLLVPLGEGYAVLDLIIRLRCQVLVVSRNRLGTINHTLLTLRALENLRRTGGPHLRLSRGERVGTGSDLPQGRVKLVLMDERSKDFSSRTNPAILSEWIAPASLISLPYLGPRCGSISALKHFAKKFQKTLARLFL
jgi:dethiobiotin synthetase